MPLEVWGGRTLPSPFRFNSVCGRMEREPTALLLCTGCDLVTLADSLDDITDDGIRGDRVGLISVCRLRIFNGAGSTFGVTEGSRSSES